MDVLALGRFLGAGGPRSSDRPLYTLVTSAIGEGRKDNLFKINTIIFFGIFSYSFISHLFYYIIDFQLKNIKALNYLI